MSARAIVSGVLHKEPTEKVSKTGNPFATFPIRENINGVTRWWQGISFNETAIEVVKGMAVGEPISVAGEISAEIYAPAGSDGRINWRVTIDAVLTARKPPKPERTVRKRKEAKGLDRTEAANTAGRLIASRSWVSPDPISTGGVPLNDDIPFMWEGR
jgi:hypothetical protein